MIEKIDNWLKDVKRRYALGLTIFMALASPDMKKKYGDYFREGDTDNVAPNDPRFPMLINKVTNLYNIVRVDPSKYADTLAKIAAPIVQTKEQIKEIIALKEETEALNDLIKELAASDDDKTDEIEQLQEEIEEKDAAIDDLKALLKAKGLKVMDGKDLPTGTKKKYDRIKAIVPLMAAIHSELKDTSITDEQRKEKAEELCDLDDERRTLWDEIDAYLNNSDAVLTEEKKVEYSEDPVIRGMQIGNRVKRLTENIKRAKDAIDKHIESKKPNLEQKARERLAEFESELKELTEVIG
ncbi:MAG: hypothetical protein LBN74_05780 [Prevotella sp.]|jgi:hypothetical protein|nr:hypothetical protein [Prevotella sp.]